MAKFVCNNFVVSLWESQSSPAKAKCVDAFNLQIPSPMTALHKRLIALRKRLIEKNCVVQDMQGKFCVASRRCTKKKGAATHYTPASDVDSCQLESPSEITTEDGIKRNFNDYDHAYEYACESTCGVIFITFNTTDMGSSSAAIVITEGNYQKSKSTGLLDTWLLE